MSITIREYEVEVDIARELQQFDWNRRKWAGDKLLACSPFRVERRPSFAVRLDNGVWIDSGTDDEAWKSGNFVKLLSWLRNETYQETENYLLQEYYHYFIQNIDGVTLDLKLPNTAQKQKPLDMGILKPFAFRHPYLGRKRGIEERVQRAFRIGYDREKKAVAFPWFDKRGNLINIKFRSINDKRFWYHPEGYMIKNHLYGFNFVLLKGKRTVYVVESEIDALSLWQAGYASVALGGAIMTEKQRQLLLQGNIEQLIIATDNDKAGRAIAKTITDQLNGYMEIYNLKFPDHAKDINDLSREELLSVVENKTTYAFAV